MTYARSVDLHAGMLPKEIVQSVQLWHEGLLSATSHHCLDTFRHPSSSPVAIAQVSQRELRDAILAVDGPDVDAIMQVGTNLAMARLASVAEFWLGKPV